jgi:hypothetical protein
MECTCSKGFSSQINIHKTPGVFELLIVEVIYVKIDFGKYKERQGYSKD